ncbi:Docking protein 7 [Nesidiocoris tenuis]|uniref:Docking protein 7 n=1 Tax=Nesidiocoris tenuis TaxID=355587 RepID=A0ABN7AMA8_9HEMI|nr:Docking protein 7 [Nesidiocoris tenuis]
MHTDCLHLQLYRDSKDRYKQGQTKASLSLQHFLGVESGFTLDKESNTIAILCQDVTVVLAFDTRERLIQWQVKIAHNLGEDQQFLIQIGSAPPKAKISPGPARLHIQEYRFSLTMGVPPRLIGVWTISQLRRYGVVDSRFCFEGGSACGRLEGVYVLVTDQGEEITKAFKAASEGKLIPKRKPVSRNSTVSVTESPRRRAGSRVKSSAGIETGDQSSSVPMWESMEAQDTSECGDTVSVMDLNMDPLPSESWTGDNAACQNCKVSNMPRSLTVFNAPGTGFNPAWIMEAMTVCDHESNRNTICCNVSVISESRSSDDSGCRSRAVSPCGGVSQSNCLVHENRTSKCLSHSSSESAPYENYDTPRSICTNVTVDQPNRTAAMMTASEEYYDTPKKIKENLNGHGYHVAPPIMHTHQAMHICSCQQMPICRHVCQQPIPQSSCSHCHPPRVKCSCQLVQMCPCQAVVACAQKHPPVACHCSNEVQPPRRAPAQETPPTVAPSAIYAKVDLLKKNKRKDKPTNEAKPTAETFKESVPNYENMGFAQSLEYYENLKDIRIRVDKFCVKCQSQHQKGKDVKGEQSKVDEEYLVMGPVCQTVKADPNVPPYLHMRPVDGNKQLKCSCIAERATNDQAVPTHTQPDTPASVTSPVMRRHDPSSCYSTVERRRMAQIRRRSNSMDSGRYLDNLDSLNTKTSSSTHNTLTPNSQNNSIDSIPSEKQETPKRIVPHFKTDVNLNDFIKRPSSVPCKANRDSSASNDSGVSTGSLKNFGGGFLEFETIITPLSKVRQRSLDTMPLVLPRRSKSSDPLDELTFKFSKTEVKSSSAEAEVPICPPKKENSKDISVSSSSGALTIPYIDSISSSSGASDMSDYIETLSMSSYSSSEHDHLRNSHSAVTFLRPRSGKEYQKIDRSNLEYGKVAAITGAHTDSPSPGYVSSTSSN